MRHISASAKNKFKIILFFCCIGILIGPLYAILTFGFAPFRIVKGAVVGLLITSASSTFEVFYLQEKLKRISFPAIIIIRSFFYIIIISFSIISVVAYHESLVRNMTITEYLASDYFSQFLLYEDFPGIFFFSVIICLVINIIWQVSSLIGFKSLAKYLTGKYHSPREEERIFMFLDLKSSTAIAEKLGAVQFHNLLNDFFFDITESIVEHKGEVYQYVGDEVVITWSVKDNLQNTNCINCYFRMKDKILSLREKYANRYGIYPEFKAGIHFGKVVTGEIGDIKKEIVYHGDVLNTASRIQKYCNDLNKIILISSDLLEKVNLNGDYQKEKIGSVKLRGKENDIELYSLHQIQQHNFKTIIGY